MTTLELDDDDNLLIERLPPHLRDRNGIPSEESRVRMQRAYQLADQALATLGIEEVIRVSPLGPGWSQDLDVHVRQLPPAASLERVGWISLDSLLARLGSPATNVWCISEAGVPMAAVDLTAEPPPPPVKAVIQRCQRRRQVRLREVLELRALKRNGAQFPPHHEILEVASRIEAHLGGSLLADELVSEGSPPPVDLSPARSLADSVRGRLQPKLVVALSGVDGAGKSSLAQLVSDYLDHVGIRSAIIWTRPGMRMDWLTRPIVRLLRLFGGPPRIPGVAQVASGSPIRLRTRRGVVGWLWTTIVTTVFLADVRLRHLRSRGVLIYDRHLPDALTTLAFVYAGVDLKLHRWLVRRLLPPADLRFYIEMSAEEATARKPGDVIGTHAVTRQLEEYDSILTTVPAFRRLDGTRTTAELANHVFRAIVGSETLGQAASTD